MTMLLFVITDKYFKIVRFKSVCAMSVSLKAHTHH